MWRAIDEHLQASGLSGVARVVGPDGVAFEGCYGLADRAAGLPVRPGTRFGLASLTKMFTAATTVATVGDVAAPVVSLLPPERRPATLRPDVTVRHLLTHTSGIADYAEEEGPEEVDYASLWVDRPCYRMERPADFLPLFGDLPPYTPPGVRFRYSNAGYVLLALVVEEVTGAPFPDAVGRHVFGPAGMAASGFFRLDELPPDVAVGYLPSGRSNVYSIPVVGGGDGGAFSTAPDLDRFLRWYETTPHAASMLAPQAEIAPGLHMGLGVFLYGEGRFGHGGGDPGGEVLVQRIPSHDSTVVVLCNVEGHAADVRDRLVEAVRTLEVRTHVR
jgi:CubicO group peptidase (beta-lactamase class C family)